MDCQMPELDGYDTAAAIRSFETDGSRVPIVAVTAHAFGVERERCLTAGMDDFLAKPYFPEQLLEVVAKWTA
jgi:CheY-like chemotaxis protein